MKVRFGWCCGPCFSPLRGPGGGAQGLSRPARDRGVGAAPPPSYQQPSVPPQLHPSDSQLRVPDHPKPPQTRSKTMRGAFDALFLEAPRGRAGGP